MNTQDDGNGVAFACGMVTAIYAKGNSATIYFRAGQELSVASIQDKGLEFVKQGRRRMVVVRDGKILAVFGRPRIRLIGMIQKGVTLTGELIDCFLPMYSPIHFR